jgi:hypothetical protein
MSNDQEDDWVKVVSEILSLFPNYHVLKSEIQQQQQHSSTAAESFEKTVQHFINICNIQQQQPEQQQQSLLKPLYTRYIQQDPISSEPTNVQTEIGGDRWASRVQQHSHFKLKVPRQSHRDYLLNPIQLLSGDKSSAAEKPPLVTPVSLKPKKINTKLPPNMANSPQQPGTPSTPQSAKPATPSFLRKSAPPAHTALAQKKSATTPTHPPSRGLKQLDESEARERLKEGATIDRRRTSYIRTLDTVDPEKERRKQERQVAKEKKEQEKLNKKKMRDEDKKRKLEEKEKKTEERKKKKDDKGVPIEPDRKRQKPNPVYTQAPGMNPMSQQKLQGTPMTSPFAFAPQQISPLMSPFPTFPVAAKLGTPTGQTPTVTSPFGLPSTFATLPTGTPTSSTFAPFGGNPSFYGQFTMPGAKPTTTPTLPQTPYNAFSPNQHVSQMQQQQQMQQLQQRASQIPKQIVTQPQQQQQQTALNQPPKLSQPLQQQIASPLTHPPKLPLSNMQPLQQQQQIQHPPQQLQQLQPQQLPQQPQQQQQLQQPQQPPQHPDQRAQLENYLNNSLLKGCNKVSPSDHLLILNFLCGKTDASSLPENKQVEQVLIHEEVKEQLQEIHQIYFQMDHKQKTWKKFLKKIQMSTGKVES